MDIDGLDPFFEEAGTIFGEIGDPAELAIMVRRRNFARTTRLPRKCSWGELLILVAKWAEAVHKCMLEYANDPNPDLWVELKHAKKVLTAQHDNTPFSQSEQAEITGQMQQLRAYIKTTYELTAEQIAEVDAKLDQAERASRHMGRKDWLMLFNGAVFSLILTDLLPSQAAQKILVMTLQGLGHLFGISGAMPQLP